MKWLTVINCRNNSEKEQIWANKKGRSHNLPQQNLSIHVLQIPFNTHSTSLTHIFVCPCSSCHPGSLGHRKMAARNRKAGVIMCLGKCTESTKWLLWHEKKIIQNKKLPSIINLTRKKRNPADVLEVFDMDLDLKMHKGTFYRMLH